MAIEILDTVEIAHREKKRIVVFGTQRFQAWVHYYATPGQHDEMHCHNADQTFCVLTGTS
jgi:hypothetical protein